MQRFLWWSGRRDDCSGNPQERPSDSMPSIWNGTIGELKGLDDAGTLVFCEDAETRSYVLGCMRQLAIATTRQPFSIY
jgi:hypothetical protein